MTDNKHSTCIGVIMDGNRRWAKKKGLPTHKGHEAGYKNLKNMMSWAEEAGVKTMIVYLFSTENWKRSQTEVALLMKLFHFVITSETEELKTKKVRIQFIGQIDRFPKKIQTAMRALEQETAHNKKFALVFAASYGGRAEITHAVNSLLAGKKKRVTEKDIEHHLWTHDTPFPDMIIRTGGDHRLSNFLLWQGAYSELFFTQTLWPDFSKKEFTELLADFIKRERRYGA